MKQTAVDWMFAQLWDTPKDKFTWHSILKEAKQKENDQMEDAYEETKLFYSPFENFNEYYQETYGKDA